MTKLEKAAAIEKAKMRKAEQEPIGMIIGGRLESLVDEYETGAWPIYAAQQPDMNLSCKSVQKRLATLWGYVKAEPVATEQEPMFFVLMQDHTWLSISEGQYEKVAPEGRMKAYAAPVRTKDLTDEEIAQAVGSPLDEVYLADFRAVIAADREKNK